MIHSRRERIGRDKRREITSPTHTRSSRNPFDNHFRAMPPASSDFQRIFRERSGDSTHDRYRYCDFYCYQRREITSPRRTLDLRGIRSTIISGGCLRLAAIFNGFFTSEAATPLIGHYRDFVARSTDSRLDSRSDFRRLDAAASSCKGERGALIPIQCAIFSSSFIIIL